MRTYPIPGGEATFITEENEMTGRRSREIDILASRLGSILPATKAATRLLVDGEVIDDRSGQIGDDGEPLFTGGDVDLTEGQYRLFFRLNDAVAWALLVTWTLPQPRPKTPDDMLDLPMDLLQRLREIGAKLNQGLEPAGFDVDDALPEDPAEPADLSLPTSA